MTRRGWRDHRHANRPGAPRTDPLDRGVIVDWPLYRITGARVPDYSGRGWHGALSAASWISSQYGQALSHVAANSAMVETADMQTLIPTLTGCTFEVIARETDSGADFTSRGIFSTGQTDSGSSQRVLGLHAHTSNNRLIMRATAGGTSQTVEVDGIYTTGVWFIAHGVYTGTHVRVYFNGREVGTAVALTGTLNGFAFTSGIQKIRTGRTFAANDGGNYLSVDIAHARFYGRGLTAGEVAKRTKILSEIMPDQARLWYFPLGKAGGAHNYNQSVGGTLSTAGGLVKTTTTPKAATLPFAGALVKSSTIPKAGALTPAADLSKLTTRPFTGTLSTAGALVASRILSAILAATLSPVGALLKLTTAPKAGTLSSAGETSKQTARALGGDLAPTGALTGVRILLAVLSAALGLAGGLTKSTTKPQIGSLSPSGNTAKTAQKVVSSDLAPTGALSALRLYLQALTASLPFSGVLSRSTTRPLDGTVAPVGDLTKSTSRALTGAFTPAGALSAIRTFLQNLTATLGLAGALQRSSSRALDASLPSSGGLLRSITRPLSGILPSAGALSRAISKTLAGVLSTAGSLTVTRLFFQALTATLTTAGNLTRTMQKTLSSALAPVGSLQRAMSRALSGVLGFIGSLVTSGGTITAVETEYLESYSRNAMLTSEPRALTGVSLARYKLGESPNRRVNITSRPRNQTLHD